MVDALLDRPKIETSDQFIVRAENHGTKREQEDTTSREAGRGRFISNNDIPSQVVALIPEKTSCRSMHELPQSVMTLVKVAGKDTRGIDSWRWTAFAGDDGLPDDRRFALFLHFIIEQRGIR